MQGASGLVFFNMAEGDDRVVGSRPLLLTSVVVCEQTTGGAASVLLAGAGGQGLYCRLRVRAGETITLADRIALPWGLKLVCEAGEVSIAVAYC